MKINIITKYLILLLFVTGTLTAKSIQYDNIQDSSRISIIIVDNQHSKNPKTKTYFTSANTVLEDFLKIKVISNNGNPVENIPVEFYKISAPAKSKTKLLSQDTVFTNKDGIAKTAINIGEAKGDYEFSARIKHGNTINDIVFFKLYVRDKDWIFFLVSGLFGGLALFLLGMEMMSDGLKKTAGGRMRSILSKITNNRLISVLAGILITIMVQSSSATTVMLVSFVQAQLMTFAQSLGIILGASIGTTITTQLIAFKLTDYALIVVAIGFAIRIIGKSKKVRNLGEGILGFGILFLGMWLMSDSMYPLRTYEPFVNILSKLENPILGILVGALFTGLIQSSGAFIGIVIVLGSQGLVTLEAAIPLLLGSNLGTSITAILASINSSREAKRVALAHSLFKLLGIVLFVWWIPSFAELVRSISPVEGTDLTSHDNFSAIPRQIANAHTLFNIILTIVILPLINVAANVITKILPDVNEEEESQFKTKFLEDSLISTPVLALSLTKAEILRMANKVKAMIEEIINPFLNYDPDVLDAILERESEIDFLNMKINRYLRKISQEPIVEERSDEIFQMMNTSTEIEQIGDIISKRLIPLANKKHELNINFSDEGVEEIKAYHLTTIKQLSRAIEFFKDVNLENAKHIKKKYKKYRMMELELRRTHFDRVLEEVPASLESSQIHLELIELLKRISSHSTNIVRILLESSKETEKEISLKAELHNIKSNKKL